MMLLGKSIHRCGIICSKALRVIVGRLLQGPLTLRAASKGHSCGLGAQLFLHNEALALLLQSPCLGEKEIGTEAPFYIQEFLFSLQPRG